MEENSLNLMNKNQKKIIMEIEDEEDDEIKDISFEDAKKDNINKKTENQDKVAEVLHNLILKNVRII